MNHWFTNETRADRLGANPDSLHPAIDNHSDPLEVRFEFAAGNARHLGADAAETFGFTAGLHSIAFARLFAGIETLFAHRSHHRVWKL